jgi:hypothetical protein
MDRRCHTGRGQFATLQVAQEFEGEKVDEFDETDHTAADAEAEHTAKRCLEGTENGKLKFWIEGIDNFSFFCSQ